MKNNLTDDEVVELVRQRPHCTGMELQVPWKRLLRLCDQRRLRSSHPQARLSKWWRRSTWTEETKPSVKAKPHKTPSPSQSTEVQTKVRATQEEREAAVADALVEAGWKEHGKTPPRVVDAVPLFASRQWPKTPPGVSPPRRRFVKSKHLVTLGKLTTALLSEVKKDGHRKLVWKFYNRDLADIKTQLAQFDETQRSSISMADGGGDRRGAVREEGFAG